MNYYTCNEIIDKYPLTKLWGWKPANVGVFFSCLLLDGKKFGRQSRTMVSEESFKQLMDFTIESISHIDASENFMSYDEIIQSIPQAEYYRWSTKNIGTFYHSKLLFGKYSNKESRNLIKESSAIRLIEFTNQRFLNIMSKK